MEKNFGGVIWTNHALQRLRERNISQGDALGVPNQGWGSDSWGIENWGESGNVVSLTGLGLTVDSGTKESWGQAGWNASTTEWGGPYIAEVAIGQQVDISGQQLNIQNLGTPLIFSATEVFLDQNPLPNLTIAEGIIDPGPDVALTGIGLTTDVGTVTAYNEQGWGRDAWGTEVWGAQGIWSFVDVTGQQLNTNLGNENIRTDVDVELDTEYNPGWGAVAWGAQTWGLGTVDMALAMPQPGAVDPEPDESLDGQQVNIALGEETITADANISLTGFGLTIAQGNAELDANTIASITGQQLNTSLNSIVAGASAEVSLTGNGLTVSVNSINVQSWQIVDTGTNVNWNIIDTAA